MNSTIAQTVAIKAATPQEAIATLNAQDTHYKHIEPTEKRGILSKLNHMLFGCMRTPAVVNPEQHESQKALSLNQSSQSIFTLAPGMYLTLPHSQTNDTLSPSVNNCHHHPDSNDAPDSDTSTISGATAWQNAGLPNHALGAPLAITQEGESEQDALNRAMQKARKLPRSSYFSSNHMMINRERFICATAPLTRSTKLDTLARAHAEQLLAQQKVEHLETSQKTTDSTTIQLLHIDPAVLEAQLSGESWHRIGSNVKTGTTLKKMHREMMRTNAQRNNIIDRRFSEMGVGVARGKNGLILCQLFAGPALKPPSETSNKTVS